MAATCPINIVVKSYRGKDRRKLLQYQEKLRIARQIEEYLNEKMNDKYHAVFTYGDISSDMGLSRELVRELLFPVDCGHNGITIVNERNKPSED